MISKGKEIIFILQITENVLKVIKCLRHDSKREFQRLEVEAIPSKLDDKKLIEKITQVFKKLGFNNNSIIVSLPRNQATCRYLKIPAQNAEEIEKIISLQASRYLPYPVEELITGYQVISIDKEGYSNINLVIAHKDVVKRYVDIFDALKVQKLSIILSSYGLCNLYVHIKPQDFGIIMLIDIDINSTYAEISIVSNRKLLFSRYFRLDRANANWQDLFVDEINRTRDAYLKEVGLEAPEKIVIFHTTRDSEKFSEIINKQTNLSVEILSYDTKISIPSDNSFVSLIGLGMEDIPQTLNLILPERKEELKKLIQRQKNFRLAILVCSTITAWTLVIAKNLDNKKKYLIYLKKELGKITKEARAIEDIEKRVRLLEGKKQKQTSTFILLYELHRLLPPGMFLTNFSFEEGNQIVLRGQAEELNSIIILISQLEESEVFKKFNVKVRYATKKKIRETELVDFEIICMQK